MPKENKVIQIAVDGTGRLTVLLENGTVWRLTRRYAEQPGQPSKEQWVQVVFSEE